MSDFFSITGPLSQVLDQYEPRPGQQQMASAVSELITRAREYHEDVQPLADILVVEAETGIGKTLAYLVPALLSGKRVVVSTATLNLQDQIMNKEIPLIEKALGNRVNALCIKGRQNYLCLYRWYQHKAQVQLSLLEDDYHDRIDEWLSHTSVGDRAELDWLPERSGLWPKISANSSQCLGGGCPEAQSCFVNQVRKQAGSASLLVVNHHLFFSDLVLRQGGFAEVLPRYEGVIFDEAHHLENTATTFFGKSFSQYQVLDLLTDIERQAEVDLHPQRYEKIVSATRGVKKRADEFSTLFPAQLGKFHLKDFIEKVSFSFWRDEVELLAAGLERLGELINQLDEAGEGWLSLLRRADELHHNLLEIALFDHEDETDSYVYWYDRRERSVSLSATPVHVADHLQTTLYHGVLWCLMTSATLSSGGNFSYLLKRLGLHEETMCLRLPSPFDFANRTVLYIPEIGFPEPADPRYADQSAKRAGELLQCSRGRGLVLCTSFRGMEYLAEYLEQNLDYPVLVQGREARNSLLKKFRQVKDSVLVAVASFWEGIDVQGDALACVIIDKLPFEVPSDPVVQARIKSINDQGGNAFFDFQVPRAILTLRQGYGRLMRSATDMGVVAVLDIRLYTKGYGNRFRRSLPPSPVVRTIESVETFYASHDSE